MANGKKEESNIQFIRRGNLTETLAAFLEGVGLDLDLAGWMQGLRRVRGWPEVTIVAKCRRWS